tara:strand:+ start:9570 stop:10298 length:729 start_codon:yes stop_codon:yes gene_type:complete
MKIGIFGDSFASYHDMGWSGLLSNEYDCVNYAGGGTSFEWTYYNFVQNYHKYDLVIVMRTGLFRTTIFNEIEEGLLRLSDDKIAALTPVMPYAPFLSVDSSLRDRMNKSPITRTDHNIYDNLNLLMTEYPYSNYLAHHAMEHSIKMSHDNIIFINVFGDDVTVPQTMAMNNITHMDCHKFNTRKEVASVRPNHMSIKQSDEFYNYIKKDIDTVDFSVNDTLWFRSIDQFYTPSTSLEDAGLE